MNVRLFSNKERFSFLAWRFINLHIIIVRVTGILNVTILCTENAQFALTRQLVAFNSVAIWRAIKHEPSSCVRMVDIRSENRQ
jgi:hypothetical protein